MISYSRVVSTVLCMMLVGVVGVASGAQDVIVREGAALRVAAATGDWVAVRVVVVGHGRRVTQVARPADSLPLPVVDVKGKALPDGVYRYEATLVPGSKQYEPQRITGAYRIAFGGVVTHELHEIVAVQKGSAANATLAAEASCIGSGCSNSETYGSEALKLKSVTPWLKFEDTSTIGNPSDDWSIIVGNNLIDRFSIFNNSQNRTPFTIEGDAHDDMLWLSGQGYVGIGTTVPESELHVSGSEPRLTIESNAQGRRFSLGVDADLHIYDGDGNMPITVSSGAPNDSLYVAVAGDVGVGGFPLERLHVRENANANSFILIENNDPGTAAAGVLRAKSNSAAVNFQAHGNGRTISRFGVPLASWTEFLSVQGNGLAIGTFNAAPLVLGTSSVARINITAAGNVGVGTASPAHPLQMASGAHVTAGGVWTNASSRVLKENIEEISADEAAAALDALKPVTFSYTAEAGETYAGFIAEDVPELVAMKDRASLSAMDVVAVLTRALKDERARNERQERAMEEIQAEMEQLRSLVIELGAKDQNDSDER